MKPGTHPVILFVINPISGGKQKDDYETVIRKHFSNPSISTSFFTLSGKDDEKHLQVCIDKVQPTTVVAVGGDGTVSMVAKKVLGTEMRLGIIPAGSANGMALELSIPEDMQDALNVIEKGQMKKMDVISINKEISLHLSDLGMNARLIKYFEEGNMRGKWGYAKVALKVLLQKQNIRVMITMNGKVIKRNAFMIVIANASKYGTGAIINPKGDLYDGLFEVVIIRHIGILTFLKMWLRPRNLDPKKIECLQATSVHLETHRKADFQVDGEYMGKVKKVDAEIMAGKLNILVPA